METMGWIFPKTGISLRPHKDHMLASFLQKQGIQGAPVLEFSRHWIFFFFTYLFFITGSARRIEDPRISPYDS